MANFKKEISIALQIIKINLTSAMELRSSFALQIIGMAINNTSLVLVWLFFFQSFGKINGWTSTEYMALLGLNAVAFGFAFAFFNGCDSLARQVNNGSFDNLLLSPRNLYLRVLTSSLSVSAIGDILFGIILLITFWIFSGSTIWQFLLLVTLTIPGALIMTNFSLITSLTSFFIPDSQGLSKNIFEIFLTPSLYPAGLFQGVLRVVFIFIIPSLVIGGLPVESVINLNWKIYAFVWIIAILWTLLAMKLLQLAIKKYESGNLTGARI